MRKILLIPALAVFLFAWQVKHVQAGQGNAAQFTLSSNSYIAATSSTELKTFSALTLEAWIKPDVAREWALIMGKQYNPGDWNPWYSYRLCKSNSGTFPDTVNFQIAPVSTGGEVGVASTTVVQNNIWTHVAGVYDGATMKIYINGVLESTANQTGDLKESDLAMFIGKAPWTNNNNFNGQMDELRVWNVARTQAQIQYAMNRSLEGNEEGLIAYWPFNDAAGSPTAEDASPYNHVGTLYNGAAIVANSTAPICYEAPSDMVSWWKAEDNGNDSIGTNHGTLQNGATYAAGKVGQAFSFDGVDDYVSGNGAQLPLGNSARAITAWVMTDSVTNQSILHYGGSDGSSPPNNLHLFIGDDRKAYIGNGWGLGTIPGTSDVSDGQWHFIAGVYEGSGTNIARIYVDGVEEANGAITEPDTATGSFEIGRFLNGTGGGQFSGLIDEVAIFNRALTADEIAAIYNAGSAGKCAPSIQHTLTVDGAGNGSGAVSATGIDCTITNGVSSGDCSEAYDEDTQVSLSPLADADSVFAGWSGDCDGNGDVTMDADKICTAAFALKTYTVTATVSGGDGTANPPSQTVNHYSTALVTAEADANYHVASMTGCGINYSSTSNDVISYTGTTAAVTADCTVTAVFVINQYTVTANATGDGTGNIQSNPGGINYNYPANNAGTTVPINHGTNVVLTATADTGSTAAWTTCSGTVAGNGTAAATCTYSSLDSDKTAEATFTAWPDLIVSSLAAGVRTYGTPLVRGVFANYMVTNQGSGDAVASCLDFYLSRDTVLDPGDVYVGTENIPGLAAGNSYGSFKGFRLSSDKWQPASGTWRVIADADACGDNEESDETNNQTSTVAGITAK